MVACWSSRWERSSLSTETCWVSEWFSWATISEYFDIFACESICLVAVSSSVAWSYVLAWSALFRASSSSSTLSLHIFSSFSLAMLFFL